MTESDAGKAGDVQRCLQLIQKKYITFPKSILSNRFIEVYYSFYAYSKFDAGFYLFD